MIIINMASSIFLFRFHSILKMSDFQEINIELREADHRYKFHGNKYELNIYLYTYIYICMYILYMYMCV